ncbi:MAG: plasmid pRiA4b ORF-3 family protein [Cyanobacteria bacterium J083]|nr:MAG: plasmid pRiA4b ORF-3 family protein [Cyanobacteria bacterium J083]
MSETNLPVIYQLKIVLVGISPMIWRRIKVSSDSTITDLHYIIQIVMGWKEEHLHQFLIHGVHYGISYPGTGGFIHNAHQVKLAQFSLREREKFSYEYDFYSNWKHQIRVEAILPNDNGLTLLVCTAGKGNCPPENCGGALGFIRLGQQHSRFKLASRVAEIILEEGIEKIANHIEELKELHYWATINDRTDCTKINHQLQQYATGDEAWKDCLNQTITIG